MKTHLLPAKSPKTTCPTILFLLQNTNSRQTRSVLPLGWCIGQLPNGRAWLDPRRLRVDDAGNLRVLVERHGVLVQAGVSKPSDVRLDGERRLARELADEHVVAAGVGGGPCVGARFWGLDVDGEGAGHGATGAHAAEGCNGWGGATLQGREEGHQLLCVVVGPASTVRLFSVCEGHHAVIEHVLLR